MRGISTAAYGLHFSSSSSGSGSIYGGSGGPLVSLLATCAHPLHLHCWLLLVSLPQTPIVGLDLPDFAGLPPPVRVGNVYQRFSSVERGIVENIIEFSIPLLLEDSKGCTFTVEAR